VIPHASFGADCVECHTAGGMAVDGVGFSPPSPHGDAMAGGLQRCEQCHVFQPGESAWRESSFAGLRQDLRHGQRLNPLTPPVIPHQVLMRENCAACHTGPAAREEIRTSHPERVRCRQCHLEQRTTEEFEMDSAGSS
jgi:cytochrome c-type protein NapB